MDVGGFCLENVPLLFVEALVSFSQHLLQRTCRKLLGKNEPRHCLQILESLGFRLAVEMALTLSVSPAVAMAEMPVFPDACLCFSSIAFFLWVDSYRRPSFKKVCGEGFSKDKSFLRNLGSVIPWKAITMSISSLVMAQKLASFLRRFLLAM